MTTTGNGTTRKHRIGVRVCHGRREGREQIQRSGRAIVVGGVCAVLHAEGLAGAVAPLIRHAPPDVIKRSESRGHVLQVCVVVRGVVALGIIPCKSNQVKFHTQQKQAVFSFTCVFSSLCD